MLCLIIGPLHLEVNDFESVIRHTYMEETLFKIHIVTAFFMGH